MTFLFPSCDRLSWGPSFLFFSAVSFFFLLSVTCLMTKSPPMTFGLSLGLVDVKVSALSQLKRKNLSCQTTWNKNRET
jgi:hypothetical protein